MFLKFWLIVLCLLGSNELLWAQVSDTVASAITLRPRGSRAQQAKHCVLLAKEHLQEGRTAEAQALLTQAIALQHDLSEAYFLRAGLKREENDLKGAIVDYSVVVYEQPEYSEARFQRARTQYDAQRYEAAHEDFQYLLDHEGSQTNALYFKGNASGGEFLASSATTMQSDMKSDLLNYIGLCAWHMRDFVQAKEYFIQATEHAPQEPMAYVNLGLSYEATGDTLRAIDFYQQALQKSPAHPIALRNLSSLARQLNDATLEKELLVTGDAPSYDALLQQGMYQHRQSDYSSAIRSFTQALRLSPQSTEVLVQRGFSYEKAGHLQEAADDYTMAIRLDPTAEKAYSNRGNVYFRLKKYAAAVTDYTQALSLNPDNAKALYNRGLAYHRLGDRGTACQDLQQALTRGNRAAAKPLAKICNSDE